MFFSRIYGKCPMDSFSRKRFFLKRVVPTVILAGSFLASVLYIATDASISANIPAEQTAKEMSDQPIDATMPANIPSEILADWKDQGGTAEEIKASLPEEYAAKCDGSFESACHWRRVYRMSQFPQLKTIMFNRRHNMGSIAIGYWVNVGSRDVTDQNFEARGALCLLKFENYYSQYKEIFTRNDMCVKDPSISMDGKKVVFAMSRGRGQGFLLYEMKIDDPNSLKQLTFNPPNLTVADFEPCYLPNGDVMFSSTRCFGTIDCGWQSTSNMFVMNGEGKYIRRLGFDQVHTFYPVLLGDGNVLYSRWEYNDRDIANICGIFRMGPDGSHQTEVFGNQTTWPMNIMQARPVPGSPNKFFGIAGAHHGAYSGEVCVMDSSIDTNGPEHVTMISPPRKTETLNKNDTMAMGGAYKNSEYPYPLNDQWYLVSYRNVGQEQFGGISNTPYKIYLKNVDGKSRELLAWGGGSLHEPMVVAPWKDIWGYDPPSVAQMADFKESTGTYTIQDVYEGEGMKGVARGAAKTIRVVALRYRVSGGCDSGFAGQVMGGKPFNVIFSAPNINPPSLWGASWDVKEVLGEAKINEDGSASFKVPARTPLYFQVLDAQGRSIASMRSWSTLMPGETFSCVGCHESKTKAPRAGTVATAGEAKPLEPTLGVENQGFDFPKFVQPILDKHCVSCHKANSPSGDLTGNLVSNGSAKKSFARSYVTLMNGIGQSTSNRAISIASIFSQAPQMPPYSYGSTKSGMIRVLTGDKDANHKGVNVSDKELRILACWIDLEAPHSGSYDAYMPAADAQRYKQLEANAQRWYDIEARNVKEFAALQQSIAGRPDGPPGAKAVAADKYLSPTALALNANSSKIYIAEKTAKRIAVLDIKTEKVSKLTDLDTEPTGIAISKDGSKLYVTAGLDFGSVKVINVATGQVTISLNTAYGPISPVLSKDDKKLFVCSQYENKVIVFDLMTNKQVASILVPRQPVAATLTPDGSKLFVANLLPFGNADSNYNAARVSVIDAKSDKLITNIELPSGSIDIQGISASPDGKYVYAAGVLARYHLPTSQVDRGWMNTNALAVIDASSNKLVNTVLLDDPDLGAANPYAIACTNDGKRLVVTHSGANELSLIDAEAMHKKLDAAKSRQSTSTAYADVPNDLSFMTGIRRRIPLKGISPRDVIIAGNKAFIAEYFTGSLGVVNLASPQVSKVTSISLGVEPEMTLVRKGEMLFHDATRCLQKWQSCVTCHPGGRVDGLNWDLLNDGIGNPKQTKSLLLAHNTAPVMITGIRPDAETAVRAGIRNILFGTYKEQNAAAIDEYLKSLKPIPSPYLKKGALGKTELSETAKKGEKLFTKARCAECHSGNYYTDQKKYNIGLGTGRDKDTLFVTPTLVEIWRTAPYLFDGRAATMKDVLIKFNKDNKHGVTSDLTDQQINDLVEFILSL
jgi:DNA-binding beta-propeller fold protein YncE/mono/diheme cytochrome c family protein